MGSSDRSRRKSAHVKPTLGPSRSSAAGKGSGSETGSGSEGGSDPGPGPGPAPSRKLIVVEIEEVNAAMARRIKLGVEVLFLYRPLEVAVVWHQDRLGRVASKHEATVRKHHPPTASITQLSASGQRMRAAFAARQ